MTKEDPEFAPDKPEALPRLHVPGLQEDAASLPPEALAGQVPVLTEQVEVDAAASTVFSSDHEATHANLSAMAPVAPNRFAAAAPAEPSPKRLSAMTPVTPNRFAASPPVTEMPSLVPAVEVPPPAAESEPSSPEVVASAPVEAAAQEPAPQADTRREQVQSRIGQLAGKIHALHDRLNQIEKPEA